MDTPADISAGITAATALLRQHGAADLGHPGGTLLAHLERVEKRLAGWGARPALRLAGLCHAFYGTDGFAESLLPLERRGELASVIGTEAEELVHFYASCDREASYGALAQPGARFRDRFTGRTSSPAPERLRDFAELTAANELDLAEVNEAIRAEHGGALLRLFTTWLPLLTDAAHRNAREVLTLRGEERQAFLHGLERGDVVTGVVSVIADFGVTFVELGGVQAMMNIPEVSWRRIDFPSDVIRVGEELAFTVLDVETEEVDGRERVSLSLKDLRPDPLRELARTRLGQAVRGTVTTGVAFGVFVRVADGVEGLLHDDDLAGRALRVGDEVDVVIAGVNVVQRRVRLTLAP
ncbi:DUF6817 domain-containing protein [Streptomyces sp. NPDC015127]|uniref:DUF6817 domain-containing protein n=1 Tax=Streptomyces sp. NPDC015127 TaxID=3364939 RepID=UPI0036F536F9